MTIDASDRATGLPSMRDDVDEALLVVAGTSGGEAVVQVPGHDEAIAVRFVHLRGLVIVDDSDEREWRQVTIAFPLELRSAVQAVVPEGVRRRWAIGEILRAYERDVRHDPASAETTWGPSTDNDGPDGRAIDRLDRLFAHTTTPQEIVAECEKTSSR